MSRLLNDLSLEFQPKAFELIARINETVGPVMVIDTIRTDEEQAINLATGHSATLSSRHLPWLLRNNTLFRDPTGKSFAIDLCPYEVWQAHGPDKLAWPTSDPRWRQMGLIGKKIGCRWGGDWYWPGDENFYDRRDPATVKPYDPGHFELPVRSIK